MMRTAKRAGCYSLIPLLMVGLGLAENAWADSAMFTGTSGVYSASASFNLVGNTLVVTLTNKSAADVLVPTDVLTGVFFDSAFALTPVSASLVAGDTVWYGSLTNVGDGWGYASGVSAQGYDNAISATGAVSGLGHSNFSGASNALDGLAYGLLGSGDDSGTGNTGVKGHGPLIKDAAQFTFTVPNGFSIPAMGTTVEFQYGTQLTEFHYTSDFYHYTPNTTVPEPGKTLELLVLALGLGGIVRLKLRS